LRVEHLVPPLIKDYEELGYKVTNTPDILSFQKKFVFVDAEGEKTANIMVEYNRNALLCLPTVRELDKPVLHSMHSIFKNQCWVRREDLTYQAGIGIISAEIVDGQINKLIKAHIESEYGTVNESPDFRYVFEGRNLIDNSRFFVTKNVVNEIITKREKDTVVISGIAIQDSSGYTVANIANLTFHKNSSIVLPNPVNNVRRVYFFVTNQVPHYDGYIPANGFLFMLEKWCAIPDGKEFLFNLEGEVFIVVIFYNAPIKQYDVVVFKKFDDKIWLLPHARIKGPESFFVRNIEEACNLSEKTVALAGIGAIGSVLGMNLLQSGIGKLYIIDRDRVDYENICRSVYTEQQIGKLKTEAFIDEAAKKTSFHKNRIEVIEMNTILDRSRLEALNIDMLVVCFGDVYMEYELSKLLRGFGFERVVFVFGQNDCTWGGVYFQNDRKLGCQQCLFFHQRENRELLIPFTPSISPAIGTGGPSYVGGINDVTILAGVAGKLIIERLITGNGINRPNHYIWQSNPDLSATKFGHPSYSLKCYRIERHHDCDC